VSRWRSYRPTDAAVGFALRPLRVVKQLSRTPRRTLRKARKQSVSFVALDLTTDGGRIAGMERGLDTDDELHCPHCAQWHPVKTRGGDGGHPYVQTMLYFECRGKTYFAGTIGSEARYAVRPPTRTESRWFMSFSRRWTAKATIVSTHATPSQSVRRTPAHHRSIVSSTTPRESTPMFRAVP
jgi:hypothetical protein